MKCLCEGTLGYKSRDFLISVSCVIFPLCDFEQGIFPMWKLVFSLNKKGGGVG